MTYRSAQDEQAARFQAWVADQGKDGLPPEELPTQLDTLMRPEQQKRLRWVAERVKGPSVLSIGCNIGYDLAFIAAYRQAFDVKHSFSGNAEQDARHGLVEPPLGVMAGIDISEPCIFIARLLAADRLFYMADARDPQIQSRRPWAPHKFDTVLCCEVLEHLAWPEDVDKAMLTALLTARKQVLITVPAPDGPDAKNKKHQWICDLDHQAEFMTRYHASIAVRDAAPGFICMEIEK